MKDSIQDIREIVEESALDASMERMETEREREIWINHHICYLHEELGDLEINRNCFAPLEIAEKLDQLREAIFSCQKPRSGRLQQELDALKRDWDHLHFFYAFPDSEELNPDSLWNNVYHNLKGKNDGILALFQEQCLAAEEVFNGKGRKSYSRLPKPVLDDVKGRLFERFPEVPLQEIGNEVLAAAIMASLGDRMMGT
jgi:hypothetical protein